MEVPKEVIKKIQKERSNLTGAHINAVVNNYWEYISDRVNDLEFKDWVRVAFIGKFRRQ